MKPNAPIGVVPAASGIARIAPARAPVARTGAPAWVVTAERRIESINPPARVLFALGDARGQPCERVFRCTLPDGTSYCAALCPWKNETRSVPQPVRADVTAGGRRRRVTLAPAFVRSPEDGAARLVHLAIVEPRRDRMERWVGRLAARSGNPSASTDCAIARLTPREREILRRLALDQTPQAIAWDLGVSYATVRNHIQHILARLDAHSIVEAVARYVIAADAPRECDAPDRSRAAHAPSVPPDALP